MKASQNSDTADPASCINAPKTPKLIEDDSDLTDVLQQLQRARAAAKELAIERARNAGSAAGAKIKLQMKKN